MTELSGKTQRRSAVWMLLGSTLISIFIMEVTLQGVYRFRVGSWLWKENTAFNVSYTQPVEDRRQYALRPGYADREKGIIINTYGFRGPSLPNQDWGIIASLGDSVPFGAGVRNHETYPAVLDELLARATNHEIRVINAAVPSYNMRQSYDRLKYDVLRYIDKGKIAAVTLQAANDVSLLTQYREKWNPDVTWADIRWSHLWNKTTNIATVYYLGKFTERFSKENGHFEQHREYSGTRMLDNLRGTLRELMSFCSSNKIPVILMPIDPFYYQTKFQKKNMTLMNWEKYKDYVGLWGHLIDEFNKELALASKQSKCMFFFDTRAVMDGGDRNQTYIDFIHYSPRGNRMIAKSLFDFVQREGFIANYRKGQVEMNQKRKQKSATG